MAERFAVPLKPGNSGGVEVDLSSRQTQYVVKDMEIWETYQLR